MKSPRRLTHLLSLLMGLLFSGMVTVLAEDPEEVPQADKTGDSFYWRGTQLYNLGRLGEAFENFERAIQKGQNVTESEAYLMQIRQEIVNRAKQRAEKDRLIQYGGDKKQSAYQVVASDRGTIRISLKGTELFEQNSTALKQGSVEILDRIAEVLTDRDGRKVELSFMDELDHVAGADDMAAERQLVVFTYLNFRRLEMQ